MRRSRKKKKKEEEEEEEKEASDLRNVMQSALASIALHLYSPANIQSATSNITW